MEADKQFVTGLYFKGRKLINKDDLKRVYAIGRTWGSSFQRDIDDLLHQQYLCIRDTLSKDFMLHYHFQFVSFQKKYRVVGLDILQVSETLETDVDTSREQCVQHSTNVAKCFEIYPMLPINFRTKIDRIFDIVTFATLFPIFYSMFENLDYDLHDNKTIVQCLSNTNTSFQALFPEGEKECKYFFYIPHEMQMLGTRNYKSLVAITKPELKQMIMDVLFHMKSCVLGVGFFETQSTFFEPMPEIDDTILDDDCIQQVENCRITIDKLHKWHRVMTANYPDTLASTALNDEYDKILARSDSLRSIAKKRKLIDDDETTLLLPAVNSYYRANQGEIETYESIQNTLTAQKQLVWHTINRLADAVATLQIRRLTLGAPVPTRAYYEDERDWMLREEKQFRETGEDIPQNYKDVLVTLSDLMRNYYTQYKFKGSRKFDTPVVILKIGYRNNDAVVEYMHIRPCAIDCGFENYVLWQLRNIVVERNYSGIVFDYCEPHHMYLLLGLGFTKEDDKYRISFGGLHYATATSWKVKQLSDFPSADNLNSQDWVNGIR